MQLTASSVNLSPRSLIADIRRCFTLIAMLLSSVCTQRSLFSTVRAGTINLWYSCILVSMLQDCGYPKICIYRAWHPRWGPRMKLFCSMQNVLDQQTACWTPLSQYKIEVKVWLKFKFVLLCLNITGMYRYLYPDWSDKPQQSVCSIKRVVSRFCSPYHDSRWRRYEGL